MDNIGLQFGLMNSLGRVAGDSPVVSLLLCALVPFLLKEVPKLLEALWKLLERYLGAGGMYYTRRIVFTQGDNMTVQSPFGPRDVLGSEETSTERNNILQKAIRLYISRDKAALHIKDAEIYLLANSSEVEKGPRMDRFGDFRQEVKFVGEMDAAVKKLMGYGVTKGPRERDYLLVDAKRKIEFMYHTNYIAPDVPDESKGKGKNSSGSGKTTTTFCLRSSGPDAEKNVDSFIEEALEAYKSQKAKSVDKSRYFFMPQLRQQDGDSGGGKGFGKGGEPPGGTYKKYLLSDHKTFNCLYFPEKEQVLSMLDDFMKLQGKFAIPGFPNKLGLLLHGPPGTGKTSLIKSIAQYTGRHIVDVPLTKVKTNQELFDKMFDLVFAVPGDDEAVRMRFENIVFVMEDVDAASKVVYRRASGKDKKKSKDRGKGKGKLPDGKDKGGLGVGKGKGKIDESGAEGSQGEENAKGQESMGKGKGKGSDGTGKAQQLLATLAKRGPPQLNRAQSHTLSLVRTITIGTDAPEPPAMPQDGDPVEEGDEEEPEEEEEELEPADKSSDSVENLAAAIGRLGGAGPREGPTGFTSRFCRDADELNLSGVLNVLDGVVDSPGRILIMTTNHPEKLDPALIRPGRINFAIELGFMKGDCLCQLAAHLMGEELTEAQAQEAKMLAERGKVTPAKVEQCCAEATSVETLLAALRKIADLER